MSFVFCRGSLRDPIRPAIPSLDQLSTAETAQDRRAIHNFTATPGDKHAAPKPWGQSPRIYLSWIAPRSIAPRNPFTGSAFDCRDSSGSQSDPQLYGNAWGQPRRPQTHGDSPHGSGFRKTFIIDRESVAFGEK